METTLLIGIGNEYRSDDGVGLLVARMIRDKKLPSVVVKEESGEGAALMEAWQGFENVILIDAVTSGAKPGTIHRLDVKAETISREFFHYSTHAFGVADAIEMARAMNTLPPKLLVYGIQGENFTAGTNISPVVQKAVKRIIEQIVSEVEVACR